MVDVEYSDAGLYHVEQAAKAAGVTLHNEAEVPRPINQTASFLEELAEEKNLLDTTAKKKQS